MAQGPDIQQLIKNLTPHKRWLLALAAIMVLMLTVIARADDFEQFHAHRILKVLLLLFTFVLLKVGLIAVGFTWTHLFDFINRLYTARPGRVMFALFAIVLVLVIFFEDLVALAVLNRFATSNVVNVLALVGIAVTVLSAISTLQQLKMQDDRIDGYDRFYDVVLDMLDDEDAPYLKFSGPTAIPGNIAFNNQDKIKRYQEKLREWIARAGAQKRATYIVPSRAMYDESYRPYENIRVVRGLWAEVVSKEEVEAQKLAAYRLAEDLRNFDRREFQTTVQLGVFDAYFFSNGRRLVYALPLHYAEARIELEKKAPDTVHPTLLGRTTTNRLVIEAFSSYFEKQCTNLTS